MTENNVLSSEPEVREEMGCLPHAYADEMIAHALAEMPNECCGIIAGSGGKPTKIYRGTNTAKSAFRYSLDPKDLFHIYKEIEEKDWEFLRIYHSHTHTPAYPSPTDVGLVFWPEALLLHHIIGEPGATHYQGFPNPSRRQMNKKLDIACPTFLSNFCICIFFLEFAAEGPLDLSTGDGFFVSSIAGIIY